MATLAAEIESAPSRPRPSLRVVASDPAPEEGEVGFATSGTSWRTVCCVGAAHVAVFAILLTTGTISLLKPKTEPVVVRMIPEQVKLAPPPPVNAPMEIVPVQVYVPPVEVQTEVRPSPLVTTTVPPPPRPVVAVPPAPAAVGVPVPVPVTPPDFDADQLNNPGPRYPAMSRRNREQGTTMLDVLVSPEGRAQDVRVATSSGFKRLDEAALSVVWHWKFIPAKQAGVAVAAHVLVPISFALSA